MLPLAEKTTTGVDGLAEGEALDPAPDGLAEGEIDGDSLGPPIDGEAEGLILALGDAEGLCDGLTD